MIYQTFLYEAGLGLVDKKAPKQVGLTESLQWLADFGWEPFGFLYASPYTTIICRRPRT